jgi:hypothetical protein
VDILTFIVVLFMAYLLWRIVDQLPDVTFRLSEIQRDLAEIRRGVDTDGRNAPAQLTSSQSKTDEEPAPAEVEEGAAAVEAAEAVGAKEE